MFSSPARWQGWIFAENGKTALEKSKAVPD